MYLRRLVRYVIALARGIVRGYVHRVLLPVVLIAGFLFGLAAFLLLALLTDLGLYLSAGGGVVVAVLTVLGLFRLVAVLLDSVERRIRP